MLDFIFWPTQRFGIWFEPSVVSASDRQQRLQPVARGDVPAQFLDDAQVGGKLHLVDQRPLVPSISLSGLASIPTFHGQGYLRTYDALFTSYFTKDFGPLHADLNLGENIWRIEGAPRPQEFVALALSTNLPPPLGVMVESYCFTDASPVAARDGGFLFAISHNPLPWLMSDFGGDLGMFPSTRGYSVFFGMSIVPILLWRPGSTGTETGGSAALSNE